MPEQESYYKFLFDSLSDAVFIGICSPGRQTNRGDSAESVLFSRDRTRRAGWHNHSY